MSLVYFGIGNIAEKTINKFGLPVFFVDNSSSIWGQEWRTRKIYNPNKLKKSDEVVICTTSYKDVIIQLKKLGIKNYRVSPILKDYVNSDKIEDLEFDILIASGLPSNSIKSNGGGVYRIQGNFKKWSIKKIYSGNCHSVVKNISTLNSNNYYYLSDSNKGIVCLDKEFRIIKKINIPLSKRVHGFQINKNNLYIACSYGDEILCINLDNTKEVNSYSIREQFDEINNLPKHHVNDIYFYKDYIYATMFSNSGSWQQGFLDGCIKKISLNTGEIVTIKNQLKMPHNIILNDEGYYVCNSLNGEVINNDNLIFKSNGFTRGLFIKKDFIIVGESKNRNYSFNRSNNLNVSLDTKINFVDLDSKAYKSIQLPWGVSEVHSITET